MRAHIDSYIRMGVGVLVSAVAFIVYYLTAAPTVSFIDSGELTSVCATLGIAHPTGYPIYTLLGRLVLLLPLTFNKAFQLNLLSGLFISTSVYLMCTLLFFLQIDRFKSRDKVDRKAINFALATSAVSSLILAFSKTFWTQALVAEVYSLHVLLMLTALLTLLKATENGSRGDAGTQSVKYYFLFAYLFGLGMANHMTMIVLIPACLYLIVTREGVKGSLVFACAIFIPAFLLGLSSYLYLPIRSSVQPVLDWGNPETLSNFFRHLSGKQYQVWMFSSLDVVVEQLGVFVKTLPTQFTPFLFPFALLGVWRLFRCHRRLLWFSIIIFVSALLYSVNYDIHDIESYFLPCFIMTAVWIGFGLILFFEFVRSKLRSWNRVAIGILLLLPLFPLTMNYSDVDTSEDYFVYDYTDNLLKGIDQGGIVISRLWDFFCSPLYYFQNVEGIRPDVVLIEQELLRRSWYYPQLRRQYPWLLEDSEKEVNEFLIELEKFETGKRYSSVTIQKKFINMINSFFTKNIDSRPLYITYEVESEIGSGFKQIPEGLAYRLFKDGQFHPCDKLEYTYRGIHDKSYSDYFHQTIISFYTNRLTARGRYLSRFEQCDEAIEYFREALWVDPSNQQAQAGLDKCEKLLEP